MQIIPMPPPPKKDLKKRKKKDKTQNPMSKQGRGCPLVVCMMIGVPVDFLDCRAGKKPRFGAGMK
jgi:hypothetical protein